VQPGLSLPLPTLPILAQPPPFSMPPPNLNIPPPTILSQAPGLGGIPFPPPSVTSTSNHIPQQRLFDHHDSQERETSETLNSPSSIDHQLTMTERQINMVEQQLSMIQQAQSMGSSQSTIPPMRTHLFHQNQPNPMIFDMHPTQLLHGGPQMIDMNQPPQIPIFANPPPMLGQPPPLLPISQAGLNQNMNGNPMHHYGGRY